MNPLPQCKPTILPLFIAGALACFGLLQPAQAIIPPPDGGYPGFNTAEGQKALFSLTTGVANTAVGWFSLFSDTTASFNTAVGAGTLLFNNADSNTAVGAAALLFNTDGTENTAVGVSALQNNTLGGSNTATGDGALFSNIEGSFNTANGASALLNNTGSGNTAIGSDALISNTTGSNNTAIGLGALAGNIAGDFNTAIGLTALGSNSTADGNTATGESALFSNIDGNFNTANGFEALVSLAAGEGNTAVGALALENSSTGSNNTALGVGAGSGVGDANNVICIGANVSGVNLSNSCFIGNIYGVNEGGVILPVYINSSGRLGTQGPSSSRRFKKEIKPMDKASEAILALKPVTFHYKSDTMDKPQFGLIAEEVAEVNPDLVVRDDKGEVYTVRYDQVNAMLLNEFLKEHKAFIEEQHKVERLEATVTQQQKQIDALTAGLQKVSAQREPNKLAPQTVKNTD
jgi:trimeric autotransporter adhesin